jgi:polar amino acid transport system substrate-binding protein
MAVMLAIIIFAASCYMTEEKQALPVENRTSLVENRTAVFSGHPDQKPIMYADGNGHIVGVGVEIIKDVFKRFNTTPEFPDLRTWPNALKEVETGGIDGVVGAYKTTAREKYAVFSNPYTNDSIVLFFPKGKGFNYTKKEDLIGKIGVITKGDSYGQEMDEFIRNNLTMITVERPEDAFTLLQESGADYFIYALWAGRNVIAEKKLTGIEESGVILNQPFYIMVSKMSPYSSPEYMDKINKALEEMKDTGEIDRVIVNVSVWNKIQALYFFTRNPP